MSWGATTYLQFADEATAGTQLAAAGLVGANSFMPLDVGVCALVAPIVEWVTRPTYGTDANGLPVVTDPGEKRTGWWAMLRLNSDWDGAAAAATALQPYAQALENPCNVFAE
jgi:hypothetical protein